MNYGRKNHPIRKKEQYFLNWNEAYNVDTAEVGSKGQNLSRLHRYAFQVPKGGILTSRSYRDFLLLNRLSDLLKAASSIEAEDVLNASAEEILANIRKKINEGKVYRG